MIKRKIIAIVFLLSLPCGRAWTDEAFLSIDPVPYFESGHHLRVGLDLNSMRYSVTTSQSDRPLYTSKPAGGVEAVSHAVGMDVDYIGKKSSGLYGGLSFVRVRWVYSHPGVSRSVRADGDLFGLKIGHRYYPRPWMFLDVHLSNYVNTGSKDDVHIAGTSSKISPRYIFPFFEIGFAY